MAKNGAKLKRSVFMALAMDVSRQPSIDPVMWLLSGQLPCRSTVKRSRELQNRKCIVWRIKAAGRVLELSPVFKEIKILRKSLIFNEVIEVVTSGQDPTQLTSNCGEEVKKSLSSEGSH